LQGWGEDSADAGFQKKKKLKRGNTERKVWSQVRREERKDLSKDESDFEGASPVGTCW